MQFQIDINEMQHRLREQEILLNKQIKNENKKYFRNVWIIRMWLTTPLITHIAPDRNPD